MSRRMPLVLKDFSDYCDEDLVVTGVSLIVRGVRP